MSVRNKHKSSAHQFLWKTENRAFSGVIGKRHQRTTLRCPRNKSEERGGSKKGNIKHALCRRFVEEESDTEEEERNQKNKKDHSRRSFCLHVWFHFVKICPTWCRLNLKEQLSSFTGDDIKGGMLKSFWSGVMWDADAWSVTRPLLASSVLKTTKRATWLPVGTEKVVVKKH